MPVPLNPPYRDPAWLPASQVDCYRAGWTAAREAATTGPAEGEALRRLIEKWRAEAEDDEMDGYNAGLMHCADELEAVLAPLSGPVDALNWVEQRLRQEWWAGHGCPFAALYGDDGEMQCNALTCMRDFKREPMEALRAHVEARRVANAIAAANVSAGPVDASGEPEQGFTVEWAARQVLEAFERDEADGYHSNERVYAITLLRKAFDLVAAAVPSSPAQEQALPESLAASIALFREDPAAWWAEWQRKHDFNVKLITENERLKAALPPSSPAQQGLQIGPWETIIDGVVQPPSSPVADSAPCVWTEDNDSVWTTTCGETWIFIDGTLKENHARFCHGCGRPIEPHGFIESLDAEETE